MADIGIVALRYLEPYYKETEKCLGACGLPVYYADRQGYGNFSKAMNEAFKNVKEEFCWFITDITFDPGTPSRLRRSMEIHDLAAIHPAHLSDHQSHRPDGTNRVNLVPYIEFTAPMFRSEVYRQVGGLDEDHWYWYQDLIISKKLRDMGLGMGVDQGNPIRHTYKRNDIQYDITKKRYALRLERDPIEIEILKKKFGQNWRKVLWAQ